MNLYAKQSWVLTSKVAGFAKGSGMFTMGASVFIDTGAFLLGYQSAGKTAVNVSVGLGAARIGGYPGLAVGLTYFGLDKLGAFDGGSQYRRKDNTSTVQDAIRVSFPIYKPR